MAFQVSRQYVKSFGFNTLNYVKNLAADTLFLRRFEAAPNEKTLFDFQSGDSIDGWGTGCDQDIGGFSTAQVEQTQYKTLRFHGNISLGLNPSSDAIYSGYSALRSRVRLPEHLFDDRTIDCSRWNYLVMRVKGDHRSYSVNFKTINSFSGDLYSCRFKFLRPYEWEEIIVPFNRFIRTNCGAEYLRQSAPNMEKITSFGFLLADHLPGPYQLDIDWIKVSNLHFSDESPEMLRNLVEPEKKRQDWIDSSRNSFGFGFDMAPGMIETAETRKRMLWNNPLPGKVYNPQWIVTPSEKKTSKVQ